MKVTFSNDSLSYEFDLLSPLGGTGLSSNQHDSVHGRYRETDKYQGVKRSGTLGFWICKTPVDRDTKLIYAYECAENVLSGTFTIAYDDGTVYTPCIIPGVVLSPEMLGYYTIRATIEVETWSDVTL